MPFLDWVNKSRAKEAAQEVPYHLLRQEAAYGEPSENLLIQGDNLLALKALIPFYAGRVKCIFIDPPYNTQSAFEHYDDKLEHSQWLSMMYPRLVLLRDLLTEDGSIWITIDDNESHYLKVLIDEIFGRSNFINQISIKAKNTAGASGGGEDKKLKKNVETLLVYVKNNTAPTGFKRFNDVFEEVDLFDLIQEMEDDGKSWKYTSVLQSYGNEVDRKVILDGAGEEILVRKIKGVNRTTIKKLINIQGIDERSAYIENFEKLFSDTNAQTSIRTRIIDEFKELTDDELLIASYIPRSGKDKGQLVEHFYISPTIRRVIWLKDTATKRKNSIIKKDKLGTLWKFFNWNNVTKEGAVRLPNGKKPEALIKTILDLATEKNDLVLDSFLGSGTTAAVAMKMGRRFIGIEMGAHAVSHCIPRLNAVVDGEQGGISTSVEWKGGGGFRFLTLGKPALTAASCISSEVLFATLAAFLWHFETGTPGDQTFDSPLLGIHNNTAYYLLYNDILGDRRPAGGNVLTQPILQMLKEITKHDGPKVIYGETCRLGAARLAAEKITFKQIPYDVRMR
jgi:adenine-specific DNA-methyltransferase